MSGSKCFHFAALLLALVQILGDRDGYHGNRLRDWDLMSEPLKQIPRHLIKARVGEIQSFSSIDWESTRSPMVGNWVGGAIVSVDADFSWLHPGTLETHWCLQQQQRKVVWSQTIQTVLNRDLEFYSFCHTLPVKSLQGWGDVVRSTFFTLQLH